MCLRIRYRFPHSGHRQRLRFPDDSLMKPASESSPPPILIAAAAESKNLKPMQSRARAWLRQRSSRGAANHRKIRTGPKTRLACQNVRDFGAPSRRSEGFRTVSRLS